MGLDEKEETQYEISLDEENIATWEINITAPIGGTYMGVFKFKTGLTPMQQIEADRDYRALLGSQAPELATPYIERMCYTLSQLRQRVSKAPPFWYESNNKFPGSHVKDEEVLTAVYEAALQSEIMFRDKLKKKREESLNKLKTYLEKKVEEDKLEDELNED